MQTLNSKISTAINNGKVYYHCKLIFSWDFILTTCLLIASIILFIRNNTTNNVWGSITTGYFVSYIIYIITYFIPNVSRKHAGTKIMCSLLNNYQYQLTSCFCSLTHLKHIYELQKDIPEIKKILETPKHPMYKICHFSTDDDLIKKFQQLQTQWEQISLYNAVYNSTFNKKIIKININEWTTILSYITTLLINSKNPTIPCNFNKAISQHINIIHDNFQLVNHIFDTQTMHRSK